MPKFYNKDSSLTAYGLACGYVETTDNKGVVVTLWKEHNCYHVRQHDRNKGERVFWESFYSLKEARKAFRKAGGKYNKTAHCQYEMSQDRLKWLAESP